MQEHNSKRICMQRKRKWVGSYQQYHNMAVNYAPQNELLFIHQFVHELTLRVQSNIWLWGFHFKQVDIQRHSIIVTLTFLTENLCNL